MRKILFTGLFLLLLYFSLSNGYMKVWFVALWGVIGIIAIFGMEEKSWWEPATLKLHPGLQFFFALTLVLATLVATDWTSLGEQDFNQAIYAFWTLTVYRHGFRWAYLHIKEWL